MDIRLNRYLGIYGYKGTRIQGLQEQSKRIQLYRDLKITVKEYNNTGIKR